MNLSKVDITECVLTSSPVRESLTPDESNIDVTDKVQTNPPTDSIYMTVICYMAYAPLCSIFAIYDKNDQKMTYMT